MRKIIVWYTSVIDVKKDKSMAYILERNLPTLYYETSMDTNSKMTNSEMYGSNSIVNNGILPTDSEIYSLNCIPKTEFSPTISNSKTYISNGMTVADIPLTNSEMYSSNSIVKNGILPTDSEIYNLNCIPKTEFSPTNSNVYSTSRMGKFDIASTTSKLDSPNNISLLDITPTISKMYSSSSISKTEISPTNSKMYSSNSISRTEISPTNSKLYSSSSISKTEILPSNSKLHSSNSISKNRSITQTEPQRKTYKNQKKASIDCSKQKLTNILDTRLGDLKNVKVIEDIGLVIDSDHDTPLHILLAKSGSESDIKDLDTSLAAKLLVQKRNYFRPYVNIPDKYQQTPLHIAVFLQSISLVTALLQIGADWCYYDCRLETPIHAAVSLANEKQENPVWTNQSTDEFLYSTNQDEAYLSFPLTAGEVGGEELDKKNSHELHGRGDPMFTILKLLLDSTNGGKALQYIDGLNEKGESALHMAVDKGRFDIAKQLITSGANVNVQETKAGYTPLMLLIKKMIYTKNEQDQHRIMLNVRSFIEEFKPDVNVASYSKDTALHLACLGDSTEIVTALLDAGANVNERNASRKSEKDLTSSKVIKGLLEKRLRKKRRKQRKSESNDDPFHTVNKKMYHQHRILLDMEMEMEL